MSESTGQLVEHFFRHESANLIAVLTRSYGVRRIELVEDMVQAAMLEAKHTWKHNGVPDNPAGWIHRAARNRILDALRREDVHQRAMAHAGQSEQASEALIDEWLDAERIPDSTLRMIFVCCHPALDRTTQIALTLKILGGFGIGEIARGLLMSKEAVKKRVQRGQRQLADLQISTDLPTDVELQDRLASVHDVLYLMFNEGYSTSHGHEAIRDDLCEEAARLCHLLCEQGKGSHTTFALLALMLFHAARLDSRLGPDGAVVLLEDQDRSTWDRGLIGVAECWLTRSGKGPRTVYHYEAAIALQHCRAESVDSTDWSIIVKLYDCLVEMHNSPLYLLNRAIARGHAGDPDIALEELQALQDRPDLRDYVLLDCARSRLEEMSGRPSDAVDSLLAALSRTTAPHEKTLIESRLKRLTDLACE